MDGNNALRNLKKFLSNFLWQRFGMYGDDVQCVHNEITNHHSKSYSRVI